jgi:hypothetical protein
VLGTLLQYYYSRIPRTLSATIGPLVALVSAAIYKEQSVRKHLGDLCYHRRLTTTPPSNMHPTIVVPVLVALGKGTPLACSAALRVWLEKSKPGMLANDDRRAPGA